MCSGEISLLPSNREDALAPGRNTGIDSFYFPEGRHVFAMAMLCITRRLLQEFFPLAEVKISSCGQIPSSGVAVFEAVFENSTTARTDTHARTHNVTHTHTHTHTPVSYTHLTLPTTAEV